MSAVPTRSPVQVAGEVLSRRRVGAYHLLTVVAPGVAERVRPGQFVAVAVGGAGSGMLLRRSFAIYAASPSGSYGGTVQFVVAPRGNGTRWLCGLRQGDALDVVGPLGTGFRLPERAGAAVLLGGGYGSAPLVPLAAALAGGGCRVDVIIGAGSADSLFAQLELKRAAASLTVTTDDGSVGIRGLVTHPLPGLIERRNPGVVYACGPMGMLRAVAQIAASYGVACQVAVEESMACGIGVCMTCVLPVRGADGTTAMVRSCTEGPVFDAATVRFADIGTVPADTFGALS